MLSVQNLKSHHLVIPRLDIAHGECVVVQGASGAGKSLLLRSIADLDVNDGEVSLDGQARRSISAFHWRLQVMLVPAESGWWADRVGEHFLMDRPVDRLIASLGLPDDVLDWEVARLSSGERHRLGLARALKLRPKIMLLDEPSAALDPVATDRLESVLKNRLRDGCGLLLVTHDHEQAKRMADRTLVITDGQLAEPTEPAG
ncbi:MAG: ABC transporter ATP-binding protein [Geminicoccaceae bacterium]